MYSLMCCRFYRNYVYHKVLNGSLKVAMEIHKSKVHATKFYVSLRGATPLLYFSANFIYSLSGILFGRIRSPEYDLLSSMILYAVMISDHRKAGKIKKKTIDLEI
ncbi:uncharacterized protein LOC111389876 [Olea europaea var. sylvestris]|uniref:uncharacterized protein LOC111389876 n=1 Tax=Olea europaea var. sylvestris TaxID=158386 RepID=UPI000C1D4EF9|nr:uncharacterized protein LOC111389876 [Olea europaea var. sylvestris]